MSGEKGRMDGFHSIGEGCLCVCRHKRGCLMEEVEGYREGSLGEKRFRGRAVSTL